MVSQKDQEPKRPAKVYDTFPKLIRRNYDQWAIETALCRKKYGIWQKYSWRQYYEIVRQLSLGFISLGLERGDIVGLLGDNEPEWLWCAFAVQAASGIPAGIPLGSGPDAVQYIINHSGAKFAFVTDKKQADKFLASNTELPALRRIIYRNPKGLKDDADPHLLSFNDVLKLGEEYRKTHPDAFEQNLDKGSGDNTAFIAYRLNTTGQPSGIVMTFNALTASAGGLLSRFPVQPEDHLFASLPAASVENNYFAVLPHLLTGAALNFPETPETITIDERETSSDFVVYDAEQWQILADQIQSKINGSNPLARSCYKTMLAAGYKTADLRLSNRKPGIFRRILNLPALWFLFNPLKDKTGLTHARFAVTSGNIVSKETLRLMLAIGVELRQTFGIGETGLVASQNLGEIDGATTRRPTINSEVRILNSGELLVRSDGMFASYFKDPAKTGAVVVDGWYHTGIPAQIDDKGQLTLLHDTAAKTEGT
jgi:long-chain acyl-CoA synthetase